MFSVEEILQATQGRLICGRLSDKVSGVSTDSRSIKGGELFVAIRGKRFDGHNFIAVALQRGAGAIMFCTSRIHKEICTEGSHNSVPMVKVKDTLAALGALAHYHRQRFKIPAVAISGSNGKTTTKEMLAHILRTRFNLLCNPGTQNNLIGVPQALFGLHNRHKLAVLELGANHFGEIRTLSWMVSPKVAIITNIGLAHLEFFHSLRGVFKAKQELLSNLAKNGQLIINSDDRFLAQLNNSKLRPITFGFNHPAQFWAENVQQTEKTICFLLNKRQRIVLKAWGRHNVYNALASIACARYFGLSYNEIKDALASFQAPPLRMQLFKVNNIKIINDCYNSNPESFRWALDFLKGSKNQGRKIVVCGDMLELGRRGQRLHLEMGKTVRQSGVDFLITMGNLAKEIAAAAYQAGMPRCSVRSCRNASSAVKLLRRYARAHDIILIKGSRAMQMENVAKCFTKYFIH